MAYAKVGPFVDGGPPYLSAVDLNTIEGGIAASAAHLLSGPGIDPTGATVSTTAVQAFLNACTDGANVTIPTGAIINLDAGLTISHRIRLTGAGELRWTAGVVGGTAITITADGTHLDGVRINNYPGTANQTGAKQYGIYIAANYVKVTGCTTLQFQQAITVATTGEWHDFIIANNNVIDVIGSGDGPSNSSSSNGEDRGDGIVSWGATGIIAGNRITAKAGTDARMGIHTEGLPNYETIPYTLADAMVAITGNVISGQFRRSIASETVAQVAIVGNVVSDATWWGIALIGAAARCVVANNTIKWTRTAGDNQGSAWTPQRTGIMVYKVGSHAIIEGNVIYAETGAVLPNGITLQAPDSSNLPTNITVRGNTIDSADQTITNGILIPSGGAGVNISDNRIQGFTAAGIYALSGVTDFIARGNLIYGVAGASTYGIRATSTVASGARADGNTIHNCGVGIALYGRTLYVTVIGNVIYTATTGLDLFQTTGATTITGNTYLSVTTKTVNVPAAAVSTGNN